MTQIEEGVEKQISSQVHVKNDMKNNCFLFAVIKQIIQ